MIKLNLNKILLAIFILLLFILMFGLNNPYHIHVFVLISIYVVLAVALRFVMLVGEINLAHAGFFGIGAYSSAVLTMHFNLPFFLSLILSAIFASLISVFFGLIAFRLKGAYFLLLSFAVAEVIRLFFQNNWTEVMGGTNGIAGIPVPMDRYSIFILALCLIVCFIFYKIENSNFGYILKAIQNSDELSQSIGVNVMKYKVIALAISSFAAGLIGSLYAHFNIVISPEDFTFNLSIIILSFIVIGGTNYFIGPILGAVIITLGIEFIRDLGSYETLVYGMAIVLAMIFMRNGIVGLVKKLIGIIKERKEMSTNVSSRSE